MPRYHTLGKIPHKRHTTFKMDYLEGWEVVR